MVLELCKSRKVHYYDAYQEIWNNLLLFCDEEYAKRQLLESMPNMGKSFVERKARDIKFCLKQAKDYFDSARVSSLITKPTLIYYGLISLTAALSILKLREKSLDSMVQGHGLIANYNNPSDISRKSFFNLSVTIGKSGGFATFCELTVSDRFKMRWSTPTIENGTRTYKRQIVLGKSMADEKVSLGYLLSYISEIHNEFTLLLPDQMGHIYLGEPYCIESQQRTEMYLRFNRNRSTITPSLLNENFSCLNKFKKIGETIDNYFYFSSDHNQILPFTKNSLIGENVFLSDNMQPYLGDFHLYYLVFFIMGSLARYKPHLWGKWLGDSKESIHLLAHRICEMAIIKLPLLMFEEIEDSLIDLF